MKDRPKTFAEAVAAAYEVRYKAEKEARQRKKRGTPTWNDGSQFLALILLLIVLVYLLWRYA